MADHALIVGATGIIGNALVERLVENGGWAISGLARHARSRDAQVAPFSRREASELCHHHAFKIRRRPRGRRSAERRMPTICRATSTNVAALLMTVGRGCAPYRGAPAFRRFDRGSRRDSHPCSAPGHASRDLESSGRYPFYPVPVQ